MYLIEYMKPPLSPNECARALKALSDETRIRIIKSLFKGEQCGTELAAELKLSQPHIAHHLGILKNAGLVNTRRKGQRVCYKLHSGVYKSLQKKTCAAIDLGCCKLSFNP